MTRYFVPKASVQTDYTMSNSRFIGTIARADTVESARTFIKSIRDEMPDASHHVYAYKIGYGTSVIEGMSDDGEPSGTAGPPVLAVLRGEDIGDTVIVITRYFGGTKLGTGGLVYAYTNAAKTAFAELEREEKIARVLIGITVPYNLYERLKQLTEKYAGLLEEDTFEADITRYIRLPLEHLPALSADLRELSNGQIEPVLLEA